MIVTAIKLYSNNVERASFGLSRADLTQNYLITSAVGLDVPDIAPQYYGLQAFTSTPKSFFNMNLKDRDIVIRVRLNPQYALGETYSSLRDNLYKAISSTNDSTVELRLFNGLIAVATITGYIKKIENQMFNLNPEMQITIKCDDPIFRSIDRVEAPLTTFGFGSPVITDSLSTAPHGFVTNVTFTASRGDWYIRKSGAADWEFRITYSFLANDVLYISTEEDNKYVYRVRVGFPDLNLADKLSSTSIWPSIFPGQNDFATLSSGIIWNTVNYKHAYWGV